MMKCPHCGSSHVRRSHMRFWEYGVRRFTRKRPHRCEDCRWRGWLLHERHQHGTHPRPHTADTVVAPQEDLDLSDIDNNIRGK